MGPLQFIKQCEWTYKGLPCEFHSENAYEDFDWECNPLLDNCPEGQYAENRQTDYLELDYIELGK